MTLSICEIVDGAREIDATEEEVWPAGLTKEVGEVRIRRDVYWARKSPPKTPWTVLTVGCLVLDALGLLDGADATVKSGGNVAREPLTRCESV